MASEIRVNKIENRSGLGTVTFADTGVDLAGIVTATTFSGSGASLTNLPAANVTGTLPAISGANLTNLPAANLTGSLPAISGANLTGIAATDNVRTGILDVAGVSTFRNTMNVGAAVTISESGIEASGIGITVANINGGQIGGRRNLVINGDMRIAQRGTSSTSSNGFYTIDRIWQYNQGTDEAPTFSQVDVSSGTPAYQAGFRKALRVTNGNQTSGAGAADQIQWETRFEAQDIANSGWNYTSPTSFLTLSYYIKSSVAQSFNLFLKTEDGTEKNMPLTTPTLTADTWTRVIFRIKGDSGISFNNDNGKGLSINFGPFLGTNYTDNSITDGEWIAWSSSTRTRDNTSTWYTTNDATLEFTGLQLEVGTQATAFEHRSKGEELSLCQRYYYMHADGSQSTGQYEPVGTGCWYNGSEFYVAIQHPTPMRTTPSLDQTSGTNYYYQNNAGSGGGFSDFSTMWKVSKNMSYLSKTGSSGTQGAASMIYVATTSSKLGFSAEL